MSYFPTDIPYMSEEELKANGIEVGRSGKPNDLELRDCHFCSRPAKVRQRGHTAVTNCPNGGKPYFVVTYSIGCFECGVFFTHESKFETTDNGGVKFFLDGYKIAADKWNKRGEK